MIIYGTSIQFTQCGKNSTRKIFNNSEIPCISLPDLALTCHFLSCHVLPYLSIPSVAFLYIAAKTLVNFFSQFLFSSRLSSPHFVISISIFIFICFPLSSHLLFPCRHLKVSFSMARLEQARLSLPGPARKTQKQFS